MRVVGAALMHALLHKTAGLQEPRHGEVWSGGRQVVHSRRCLSCPTNHAANPCACTSRPPCTVGGGLGRAGC
eukprot:2593022-Alexandrium_andersonii.AAC.1